MEEYARLYDLPELYEKWFIVPKETYDRKLTDQVRFVLHTLKTKTEDITSYTVFTTTECNARCFYCYEKDARCVTMKEETAIRLVEFIEKHHGSHPVKLNWFGGEPLYNISVIDIITEELKKRNIEFSSDMISNGYLLDKAVVRKAKEQWKDLLLYILKQDKKSLENITIYDKKACKYSFNNNSNDPVRMYEVPAE